MEHRNKNGVCQRCGAHKPEHIAAPCAPRVVYVPSRNSVMDFISPEGLTFYGRKTFADCVNEDADAVIMDADEAYALYESRFRAPVSEVTEERYHDALNVLPPGKWTRIGGGEESFHVTERIAGNIVSWFVKCGDRYFTLADEAGLIHSDIMPRVRVYIEDHPASN